MSMDEDDHNNNNHKNSNNTEEDEENAAMDTTTQEKEDENDDGDGEEEGKEEEEKEEEEETTTPPSTTTTGTTKGVIVGGPISQKSFALLDGIHEDPETGSRERVTISLTRLPATLGRSHETEDPHFFGLGKKKALSRKQCMIYYRDAQGGRVEWDEKAKELVYNNDNEDADADGTIDNDKLLKGSGGLPPRGFFVIECLGKNRILVNKERVDQGDSAVLEQGTPIRISSYMLYFMLPTDAPPKVHTIPPPNSSDNHKHSHSHSNKRPPAPASVDDSSQGGGPDKSANASTSNKKSKTSMGANFQSELDSLPVETLLERMTEAIEKNEWERRHQLIGSTIALHAVRHAAHDPDIQALALDGGVSRSAIMAWIEKSDKYSEWVQQMLTKMEARSYQAAVTKSLLKAGFTRTGSSGRYIKWLLPDDIPIKPSTNKTKSPKKGKKQQQEGKVEETNEEQEEEGDDEQQEEDEEEEDDEEEEEEEEEKDGGEEEEDNDNDNEDEEESDNENNEDKASADGGDSDEESGSELERDTPAGGGGEDEEEEEDDNEDDDDGVEDDDEE